MAYSVDLTGYHLTFDAEMSSDADMAQFKNAYSNGGRSLYSNKEAEYYVDYDTLNPANPFSFQDGALVITARPISSGGMPYTSGMLQTSDTFTQNQGYFEIRALVPDDRGFWSAFWMLPKDEYFPEIDIIEQPNNIGQNSAYFSRIGTPTDNTGGFNYTGTDLSAGYHSYGFLWTADTVQFTFDGKLIGSPHEAPPSLSDLQMYLIANLAVGTQYAWPGAPEDNAAASLKIDYIRAYSNDPATASVSLQPISSPDGVDTTPVLNPVTLQPAEAPTDSLFVVVSGDAFDGPARFIVSVDGVRQGGIRTVDASHSAGETQTFAILGHFGSAAHQVDIDFVNDNYDYVSQQGRNLYVHQIVYDGIVYTGGSATNSGGTNFTDVAYVSTYGTASFTTQDMAILGPISGAPPVLQSAAVSGSTVVLTYSEALDAAHAPAAGAFTVTANGTTVAVTGVAVNSSNHTVSLTLASKVESGQAVAVSYADPTANNDALAIQDLAGNDALSLVKQNAVNVTPDTTAPVLQSATVNGSTVVLTYSEALDAAHAPAAGAFTVTANGTTVAVTGVAVDSANHTVSLTLASKVESGQAVAVSYADPTANNDALAIQDLAGNDALSLVKQNAVNVTPDTTAPVLQSATVNGSTVVLTYSEALDAAHAPAAGAFTVTANGTTVAVTGVAVDSANHTVSLTLASKVESGQAVAVSYADPTANNDALAIQDLAGNDALSLVKQNAVNVTPDTTAPVLQSATVNGSTVVLTYSEALDAAHAPAAGAFTVTANGTTVAVTGVAVDSANHTVSLTLASKVESGQAVAVSYADPTANNDALAIQDLAGNDALSLVKQNAVYVTPDTTAPVLQSATVNGSTVVLTYSEALDAAHAPAAGAFTVTANGTTVAVTGVAVDSANHTVSLTLASKVESGQAVAVSYADPTANNDALAIQDLAGNDALSLVKQNAVNVTPDTTAPVLQSATVNGSTVVLTYSEALDAAHAPAAGAFTVTANGTTVAVTGVAVDSANHTVSLTLASKVESGQAVAVSYADPTANNDALAIQDLAGNDALSLVKQNAVNVTPDTTAPVLQSATVNGSTVVLTYSEALDAAHAPAAGAFTVTANGTTVAVTGVAVDSANHTVSLTLASKVESGQAVAVSYADPTANNDALAIQDLAGNDALSLVKQNAVNASPSGTAGSDTLVFRVSGDSFQGDPHFIVTVDGRQVGGTLTTSASHAAGQTQDITLSGSFGVGAHDVAIKFIDDVYGGSPTADRNMYVHQVTFNSQVIAGDTAINTAGPNADGIAKLWNSGSATFHTTDTTTPVPVDPTPTPTPTPAGSDTLVFRVSGDSFQGDPHFIVTVDGRQVGGTLTTSASHAAGQTQDITLSGSFGVGAHDVAVKFIDDVYGGSPTADRNMYVHQVTFNSQVIAGDTAINTAGPNADGIAKLWNSGSATFHTTDTTTPVPVDPTPTPTPTPAGSDTLVFRVSGDSFQGDPHFIVTVDGRQVGGTLTTSASHAAGQTQDITLSGSFGVGAHDVAVKFIDDVYGGSPTADRNMYVHQVTFNSQVIAGDTAINTAGPNADGIAKLWNSGSATFHLDWYTA